MGKTMYKGLRVFIVGVLAACSLLTWAALVYAGNTPADPDTLSSKDIILILLALLQTILIGVGVWLVTNDKELFIRMGKVETKQQVRDELCEERNKPSGAEHHHQRASDSNPVAALKEALEAIRKLIEPANP